MRLFSSFQRVSTPKIELLITFFGHNLGYSFNVYFFLVRDFTRRASDRSSTSVATGAFAGSFFATRRGVLGIFAAIFRGVRWGPLMFGIARLNVT